MLVTMLSSKEKEEVINNIKNQHWEKWLNRPFQAFFLSFFEDSTSKESFAKIGVQLNQSFPQLFQHGSWYIENDELRKFDEDIGKHLEIHPMIEITESLEKFKKKSEEKINELINADISIEEKFSELFSIFTLGSTYIWFAHGAESYYKRKLDEEVPKYVKSDIDLFIGDASFPEKKNTHAEFEKAMRSNMSSEDIAKKFGWTKVRGDYSEPYTAKEIDSMRKELGPEKEIIPVHIPKELVELFNQVRELVFYRTERTDVFYKLLSDAKPIFEELAKKHTISSKELRYYRAKSFLAENPEKYIAHCSFAYDGNKTIFQDEPIITDFVSEKEELTGKIAYKGIITGTVKIVRNTLELDKVKVGDILVTPMTFPSFISAMNRACAFITDEGGITCHAAIVAREMKKPCIIGTKNATIVLKDGDKVEVDAIKGKVRILS